MKIGIVGHGAEKFTTKSSIEAKDVITDIIRGAFGFSDLTIVSGHSPMKGVDFWAEELAKTWNIKTLICAPDKDHMHWVCPGCDGILEKRLECDSKNIVLLFGYKLRNIAIAKESDILHVILVDKLPPNYKGMKFEKCYHCNSTEHVKSGACWTAKIAKKLGKEVIYHIIKQEE